MNKVIALLISLAFAFATVGYADAQATKTEEMKKDDKKAADMAEKKAKCLENAKTDKEKAACEKGAKSKKAAAKKTDDMKKADDTAKK
jgi:DC-EC repeat protein